MKKLFIYSLCALSLGCFCATSSEARVNTSNFFVDNGNTNVVSVSQALKSSNKTPVVLEGNFIRQIDDDEFIFTDKTGQVRVDVDDNVMMQYANAQITPTTLIRIQGSVDKELMEETKVDVFKLDLVTK